MISVLTGDVENSGKNLNQPWLTVLKDNLDACGTTPKDWEVYRGDEFQLRIATDQALFTAIRLKAAIKTMKGLDVRISIGIGDESHPAPRISEANGTAYTRSGRQFSDLKRNKRKLAIDSGNREWDQTMNLILQLGCDFMDDWSQVSAEFVYLAMTRPEASQQELANELHIQQSAISQRQKRARWPLVVDLLSYYDSRISQL